MTYNDSPVESFEVVTCDFCEGTKIDKHFGTTCIECQEYSFEHVLTFLRSMLTIRPEDDQVLQKIRDSKITVQELKIQAFKFHRAHLANISLESGLQKANSWIKKLNFRYQRATRPDLTVAQILEIVVDQVLTCRKQIKQNEFEVRLSKIKSLRESSRIEIEELLKRNAAFNFEAPSFIYLIKHHGYAALKVGISTVTAMDKRISSHRNHGWVQIKTWKVESGLAAMDIERRVLVWWRVEKNAKFGCTSNEMPHGGYTETVPSADFDDIEVISKIEELIALEGVLEYRYPNIFSPN